MQPNRRHFNQHMFHMAGWLFADLLLVLSIIFVTASTTSRQQAKTPPTPTLVSTPTPTQPPQALDSRPLDFTVMVNPSQLSQPDTIASVENQVNQSLYQSNDSNRQVGFVLTLAGGANGVQHAARFNAILQSIPPFRGAILKNYHDLGHPTGEFDLEVYFFG